MNKTIYILIDCSESMGGSRVAMVNHTMHKIFGEVFPAALAENFTSLDIYVKVIGFAPTGLENNVFEIIPKTNINACAGWVDMTHDMFKGKTPIGEAIKAIIYYDILGGIGEPHINEVIPLVIVISDGLSDCGNPTYDEVLEWGDKTSDKYVGAFRKTFRVAIGIDAYGIGRENLKKFGSISKRMELRGIKSYYDCSEEYVDALVDILRPPPMASIY